jgi:chromosome segregation ATPase
LRETGVAAAALACFDHLHLAFWPALYSGRLVVVAAEDSDVEARIARLESDVGHVRSSLSELNVKVDKVREELNAKIDRVNLQLAEKIESIRKELNARIDQVRDELNAKIDQVRGELRAKIDRVNAELGAKIDDVWKELDAKIESVAARLDARIGRLQEAFNAAMMWAILLYVALAAGMYATMARGFGWL